VPKERSNSVHESWSDMSSTNKDRPQQCPATQDAETEQKATEATLLCILKYNHTT